MSIPTPSPGFTGVRHSVLSEQRDEAGYHFLRVVEYRFPCGSVVPYVEAGEYDPHAEAPARLLSFSAAVHLLQNVGDNEVWEIGNRIKQQGSAT